MVNNFNELIDKIKETVSQDTLRKYIRADTEPVANAFNKHIINWLKAKNYPLRKGALTASTANRIDPFYGMTPTQRIHNEKPLAEKQQKPQFHKLTRGDGGWRIYFNNTAVHAPLFFEEMPEHSISGNPWLIFHWGKPLPWNALDTHIKGRKEGTVRKMAQVEKHPGHMRYADFIDAIFNEEYVSQLDSGVGSGLRNVVNKVLGALFK